MSSPPSCCQMWVVVICHLSKTKSRLPSALEVSAHSLCLNSQKSFAEVCPRLSQKCGSAILPTSDGLKVIATQSPKSSQASQSEDAFWDTPPVLLGGDNSLSLYQLVSLLQRFLSWVYWINRGVHTMLLHCSSPSKDLKIAPESWAKWQ